MAFGKSHDVDSMPLDFRSYVEWLREISIALGSNFPKVSHDAYLWAVAQSHVQGGGAKSRKFWAYAPGQGADHWEEFYEVGLLAIGWDSTGDLRQYADKEALKRRMHELWPGPSPTMNALACWNFANVMKVGDIVFAKQGKRKVVGYGVVSGDYLFDDKRQAFKSTRRMKWLGKGAWNLPEDDQLPMKTLTDISRHPDVVGRISRLVGLDLAKVPPGGTIPKPIDKANTVQTPPPYTKEMAMEKLFLPEKPVRRCTGSAAREEEPGTARVSRRRQDVCSPAPCDGADRNRRSAVHRNDPVSPILFIRGLHSGVQANGERNFRTQVRYFPSILQEGTAERRQERSLRVHH